jgi:exopolyphosphatase/guanosine-5'-triphosphate,3'-diphosphate pyrophosphatase
VRVAAVDIGTNTTRVLIAGVAGEQVTRLDRRAIVTRLGQGVDVNRRLLPEAIDRTVEVLAGYAEAIREAGCTRVRAVATSATRDATNRNDFLDAAAAVLGVRPEMITGEEEAQLSFSGTAAGAAGPSPYLVVDLGGGSTEFVLGTESPTYLVSVDIGSVRLTEQALAEHPASPARISEARRRVDDVLAAGVALPEAPGTALGVGGTFTSLAAIHLGLETYDPDRVDGTRLHIDDLVGLVDRLAPLTIAETEAIPALDPARAPVLLGGAVVAERAVRYSGADAIVVSEHDILDGIVRSLAS